MVVDCPACTGPLPIPTPADGYSPCKSAEALAEAIFQSLIQNDYQIFSDFLIPSLKDMLEVIGHLPEKTRPELNDSEVYDLHADQSIDLQHQWTSIRKAMGKDGFQLTKTSIDQMATTNIPEAKNPYGSLRLEAVSIRVICEGKTGEIKLGEVILLSRGWVLSEEISWNLA